MLASSLATIQMACSRDSASPSSQTKLKLFASAAGYCQNPNCQELLFVDTGAKTIHVAEVAHVIAASSAGPRADPRLSEEQKGSYDNLILLCPRCHTIVDKAPEDYSEQLLFRWKTEHVRKISELFGAVEYGTRENAREAIVPALAENRAIFDRFNPDNEYRENPESELATAWRRRVRNQIIPNNRRILAVLDANRRWLEDRELATLEQFRQHVGYLEARHLGEELPSATTRFPVEINSILAK